jgi:hypothetical protein
VIPLPWYFWVLVVLMPITAIGLPLLVQWIKRRQARIDDRDDAGS